MSKQLPSISLAAKKAPNSLFSFLILDLARYSIHVPHAICKLKCCFISRSPGESKGKWIALLPLEKAPWWSTMIFSTFHVLWYCCQDAWGDILPNLELYESHSDVHVGSDWAQVTNKVIWIGHSPGLGLSNLGLFPIPIWPLKYPHCSQLMPLVGWGSPTSAEVWLVFKHQPRKCILNISASDFLKSCMESLLIEKVKCKS